MEACLCFGENGEQESWEVVYRNIKCMVHTSDHSYSLALSLRRIIHVKDANRTAQGIKITARTGGHGHRA